ncbi:MAG: SUMF1/EgtB/PvdO family nonheme iron enzyme [Flavobacteriales bacterium]
MKKLACFFMGVVVLWSCSSGPKGELVGTNREQFYQEVPFGMLFIPLGSFHMGPSYEQITHNQTSQTKSVSVQSFYIDETEITNDEYRQFVNYVRDSIAHYKLVDVDADHIVSQGEYGEHIDWDVKIKYDDPDNTDALADMFLPEAERFYKVKQLDARRMNFVYYWIDFKTAAVKGDVSNRYEYDDVANGKPMKERTLDSWKYRDVYGDGITDRSQFIKREIVNVYPDTLSWVHDFTYSFNEPMTQMYYWHPVYDHYPAVGVNWNQAKAFCVWRTHLMNDYRTSMEQAIVNDFRLPTESEWEYAARGGYDQSPYPWGGPYIRNSRGCFLGNFKPLRGNYVDDGGLHTIIVAHYWPNGFGLFDMAGNVSEWTSNAFEESAYNFAHDLNLDFTYNANEDDAPALKRKVIRGGSWKDIGYYMQTGARTYEYQDTAKCYVGFRCVQTYLGRKMGDVNDSQVY